MDEVVQTISQMRNTFTKQEVIDLTCASPGTANKALNAAVTAGAITDAGGNPKKYQPSKWQRFEQRRQHRSRHPEDGSPCGNVAL